jgi:hypothetical protein
MLQGKRDSGEGGAGQWAALKLGLVLYSSS